MCTWVLTSLCDALISHCVMPCSHTVSCLALTLCDAHRLPGWYVGGGVGVDALSVHEHHTIPLLLLE
jgi:hypothetical protein